MTALATFGYLISSLDGDLFKYTPYIKDLFLYNNNITNIGIDLLTDLVDLRRVDIGNNPCTQHYIAIGPDMIELLKHELLLNCPRIEHCNIRCTINEEVKDLRNQLTEQKQMIDQLNIVVVKL